MTLKTPLVASASPLSMTVSGVEELADAGIGAVVLFSIFEEQLENDNVQLMRKLSQGTGYAEIVSTVASSERLRLGPTGYLLHVDACKRAVDIPIIASINAVRSLHWDRYARLLQDLGADAIELNLYELPTDPEVTAAQVEDRYLRLVERVSGSVDLPVSVKISPYFSSLPNMARRLVDAGARSLVLFNRFYQPDLDLENDRISPQLNLSVPEEMRARLQWIGLLSRKVPTEYAATGGVHSAADALKLLRVGASVVMLCSTLLSKGLGQIKRIHQDMNAWMGSHDVRNLDELRALPLGFPEGLNRVQYLRTLESWDESALRENGGGPLLVR
jgi:dihydroorotate dehydrogenase (fumarate)